MICSAPVTGVFSFRQWRKLSVLEKFPKSKSISLFCVFSSGKNSWEFYLKPYFKSVKYHYSMYYLYRNQQFETKSDGILT